MAVRQIPIKLFALNKKDNSTLRPAASSAAYSLNVEILEPFNVESFGVKVRASSDYPHIGDTNYAYVGNGVYFIDRYYYVSWTFSKGFWYGAFAEDTLASWRGTILNSTQYIKRTNVSGYYDDGIVDSMYGTTMSNIGRWSATGDVNNKWFGINEITNEQSLGDENGKWCMILNINACRYSNSEQTSVTDLPQETAGFDEPQTQRPFMRSNLICVRASKANMLRIQRLLNGFTNESDPDVELMSLAKVLNDVYLVPFEPKPLEYADASHTTPSKHQWIIWGSINQSAKVQALTGTQSGCMNIEFYEVNPYSLNETDISITLPNNWKSVYRYCNTGNYTKMIVKFAPFGNFELDANDYLESTANHVTLTAKTDVTTGDSQIVLTTQNNTQIVAASNVAMHMQFSAYQNNSAAHTRAKNAAIANAISATISAGAFAAATGMGAVKNAQTSWGRSPEEVGQYLIDNPNLVARGPSGNLYGPTDAELNEITKTQQTMVTKMGFKPGNFSGMAGYGAINSVTNMINAWAAVSNLAPVQGFASMEGQPSCKLVDGYPTLYIIRYKEVPRDDDRFGRPAAVIATLSSVQSAAGVNQIPMVICQGALIGQTTTSSLTGAIMTRNEKLLVQDALNSGIYLE